MPAKINAARLRKNIEELADFGRQNTGGIRRESFSKADTAAKSWLLEKIESAGLTARKDKADNVWGRLGTGGPYVMAGSHIDTVPEGGMFDGALGVLAALESLQTIREQDLALKRPLEMVGFRNCFDTQQRDSLSDHFHHPEVKASSEKGHGLLSNVAPNSSHQWRRSRSPCGRLHR